MTGPACPSCGETEELRGRSTEGEITITCQRCGAEWMRGEPRCQVCGRIGGETAPQPMTRHPRGTLLAVVGVRHIPLCGHCDAEVLAHARIRKRPVPEGYVSRFLLGEPADNEPAAPARAGPRSTAASGRVIPSSQVAPPRPTAPQRRQAPLVDPTVRQATAAFLNEADDPGDSLILVLLGTKLGASTRLTRLDTVETALDVGHWVRETFADRADRRQAAAKTLRRAFAHWRAHGWLTQDLGAGLE